MATAPSGETVAIQLTDGSLLRYQSCEPKHFMIFLAFLKIFWPYLQPTCCPLWYILFFSRKQGQVPSFFVVCIWYGFSLAEVIELIACNVDYFNGEVAK